MDKLPEEPLSHLAARGAARLKKTNSFRPRFTANSSSWPIQKQAALTGRAIAGLLHGAVQPHRDHILRAPIDDPARVCMLSQLGAMQGSPERPMRTHSPSPFLGQS